MLALSVRYLCHIVSGYIFYGLWAEWFFGDAIGNLAVSRWILNTFSGSSLSLIYSVVYNGCYMIPEIIITALAAIPVARISAVKVLEKKS